MIANFNFFLKSIYKILIISLIFSCTNKNNPLLEDWKGQWLDWLIARAKMQ